MSNPDQTKTPSDPKGPNSPASEPVKQDRDGGTHNTGSQGQRDHDVGTYQQGTANQPKKP